MQKNRFFLFLPLVLLLVLTACSSYRTDVSVFDLAAAVEKAADPGNHTMTSANVDYIADLMGLDVSSCAEYEIRVPDSTTNMDEYGIFRFDSEDDAAAFQKQVDAYLKRYDERWMPEYLPEEYPKIKNAESILCGRYVMYAILGDASRETAFNAFRSGLK